MANKSFKDEDHNEFLSRIQQEKMRELWDDKSDEVWENVLDSIKRID